MFAVVKMGSLQYKVSEGDTILVDRLESEKAKSVTFDQVLFYAKGSDVRIGQPLLKDVKVSAKVVEHPLGDKLIAFKYKKRKSSEIKKGHRQKLTSLNVTKIAAS